MTSPDSDSHPVEAGLALRSTTKFAFVTLLTSDTYLPGVLVLAHSLRKAHSLIANPAGTLTPSDIANLGTVGLAKAHHGDEKTVDLVCLVTPATVSVKSIHILVRHFDKVIGVEPLSFKSFATNFLNRSARDNQHDTQRFTQDAKAAKHVRNETKRKLALLGRPDLGEGAGASLTKLHAWRLTCYDKVIYLDADMVILKPIAHLFSTSAFAAAPDIGWPDSFNSGLLVLTPNLTTFAWLRDFAVQRGSWDGADQGLLNDFFGGEQNTPDAGYEGGWQRLPFRYNVTPNAGYTFTPAYERYGRGIMGVHFIGRSKPWNQPLPSASNIHGGTTDHNALLQRWHEYFHECYPGMHREIAGSADVIHTERGVEVVERKSLLPTFETVWNRESDYLYSEARNRRHGSRRRSRGNLSGILQGPGQVDDLKEMFSPDLVAASAAAELEVMARQLDRESYEGVYLNFPLESRTSLMPADLDSNSESPISNGEEGQQSKKAEWSPPKISWDPAQGPPPTTGGSAEYQMRNPVDTHYINAWDQPASSMPRGKAAFFDSSHDRLMQDKTLHKLQREHFFDNLGSEQPDTNKVRPVFPWESEPTDSKVITRIFPDEEPSSVVPGSQDHCASLEAASGFTPEESSEDPGHQDEYLYLKGEHGGPSSGIPSNLNYVNAWDKVNSIGRYARRLRSTSGAGVTPLRSQTHEQQRVVRHRHSGDARRVPGDHLPVQSNTRPGEASADQSGDGDNESSSSSEDDVAERGGATWRREGPGPGYQRKAESHYGTSPRSPRHPSSSSSLNFSQQRSSGGFDPGYLNRDGRRSRTSSINSDHRSHGSSARNRGGSYRGYSTHTTYSSVYPDVGPDTFSEYSTLSGRNHMYGTQRSPSSSNAESAVNSTSSSPTTAIGTPMNLSPNQSRNDLQQISRAANAHHTSSHTRRGLWRVFE